MNEIISYIAGTLRNPKAASDFVSEVEKAINGRVQSTEVFEQYANIAEHEYPYYTIRVKNYTVFYVVIPEGSSKVMEVRRLLYSRRIFSSSLI